MLKHMISPVPGGGTPVTHLDSYTPDRHPNHPQHQHERSLYGNTLVGKPLPNGHVGHLPNGHVAHLEQSRLPNGHVATHVHTPQPINMRLNHSQALSTLSTSKHSLGGGTSSSVSPKLANGGSHIIRAPLSPHPSILLPHLSRFITRSRQAGVKEMLTSLGLLCLISLLLALLSLIFLLKITPVTAGEVKDFLRAEQLTIISPEEYVVVYEITLALCSLTLSLNLCCLLVCAVQFLFAVKLVNASEGAERTNKYLQKSNITRICAVGGFFISIPVFLTGIILYTFIQFHSTPAIITSSLIGAGIIFCGCAMVHNVFVWQMEKTNAVRALAQQTAAARLAATSSPLGPSPEELGGPMGPSNKSSCSGGRDLASPGLQATLDLSRVTHELSTLV